MRLCRSLRAMILFLALFASPVAAQTDQQIWGELTLDWIKSHMLTFGVDVEPKLLVAKQPGEPGWATLDVTPRTEYARGKWFDIVGELIKERQPRHRLVLRNFARVEWRNLRYSDAHRRLRPSGIATASNHCFR